MPAERAPLYRGTPWKSIALGYRSGYVVSAVKGAGNNVWFADSSEAVLDQTVPFLGEITPAGTTTLYHPPQFTFDGYSVPLDLQAGSNGLTYFVDDAFGYGYTTASGASTLFQTECLDPGCGKWPTGLQSPDGGEMAVTADGTAWFGADVSSPQPFAAYLVRANGPSETFIPLPNALSGQPPVDFALGPDGNPWFTSSITPFVNKVDRSTNAITSFRVPANLISGHGYAEDLVTGPDGNVWVDLCGTSENKLLRVTETGAMSAYALPPLLSAACVVSSHGLIAGPGQAIWSLLGPTSVLRVSTATGQYETYNIYPTPKIDGALSTIALGADGNLWAFPQSSTDVYVFDPTYEIATQPSSLNVTMHGSATVTLSEGRYEGEFNGKSDTCASVARVGSTNQFQVTGKVAGSCFARFSDTIGLATAYVRVVVTP